MASGTTTLRELLVSIGLDADEDAIDSFDEGIESIKGHLSDLATVAAGTFAVLAAGAVTLIAGATATGAFAEEVVEQAAALGVTTDAYQELSFAASRYGIDSEKITVILSKLAVDQKAIADGNKDVAATYAALGLSAEEVAKARPEQLLALMADGFTGVTDASERLAIASSLFGDRIASKLLPLLAGGSAGLAEMAAEAHALGVILDSEAIDRANAFNDQVEVLGAVVTSLRNEVALALIPTLTRLSGDFLDWIRTNRELIDTKIEEWIGRVASAFSKAGEVIAIVNDRVGGVEGWARLATLLSGLTTAGGIAYVITKFLLLAAAVVQTTAAAAAFVGGGTVLLAIVGAIAAVLTNLIAVAGFLGAQLLVIEDFVTYLEGGDSVFGRLIEKWREAPGLLGAVSRFLESVGAVGRAVFALLEIGWDSFVATVQPGIDIIKGIGSAILEYIGGALDYVVPLLDTATKGLNLLASALGSDAAQTGAGLAGLSAGSFVRAGIDPSAQVAGASMVADQAARLPGGVSNPTPSIGGDTFHNTFNGTGLSADEVAQLVERMVAATRRGTAETFRAAEV